MNYDCYGACVDGCVCAAAHVGKLVRVCGICKTTLAQYGYVFWNQPIDNYKLYCACMVPDNKRKSDSPKHLNLLTYSWFPVVYRGA